MTTQSTPRPPVVAVMGHIDHGKSALLDYIRHTNVVEHEAGGITQHVSAYEVEHGEAKRKITFLDTPGHEAFKEMRSRGAAVADVAVVVVSAEEGVKPQTKEALGAILDAHIPYIVAINKIDKPNADIEKTKASLLENEIYLEGLGGNIPYVPISAKTGAGVNDLLDLLLLAADLEELSGDPRQPASGVVIESNIDQQKGISATLVIKNGSIKSGMFVVIGNCFAPVRIMENFLGKSIKEASFSSPIRVVGFNSVPHVGMEFTAIATKKEAERLVAWFKDAHTDSTVPHAVNTVEENGLHTIPVIIKADVVGSLDAIQHEVFKIPHDRVDIKIIQKGVGTISEGDVKAAGNNKNTVIVGFHVSIDPRAQERAQRLGVEVKTFDIIYELAEWLTQSVATRTPKESVAETVGTATVLKVFNSSKNKHVVGARLDSGTLTVGGNIKIVRRDTEIGQGKITALQKTKEKVSQVLEGECGVEIQSKVSPAPQDIIEGFIITER